MKEQYFEPLYLIRTEINDIITPLMSFTSIKDETRLNEFKKVLNFIKEDLNNNCIENESKNIKKRIFHLKI